MKTAWLCFVLLIVLSAAALAQSRWDSSYKRKCSMVLAARAHGWCALSRAEMYAKVNCNSENDIGNATLNSDGGPSKPCLVAADAGPGCDRFRFPTGEKYYSQLLPNETLVVIYSPDGGTCDVFEGQ